MSHALSRRHCRLETAPDGPTLRLPDFVEGLMCQTCRRQACSTTCQGLRKRKRLLQQVQSQEAH